MYGAGIAGGTMILDKYPPTEKDRELPESDAKTEENTKIGRRHPIESEVNCTA